jgi:hypothetical protein
MTILPRVNGGLTFEHQDEPSPDATNPVVASADFVLEVSHARSTMALRVTFYL